MRVSILTINIRVLAHDVVTLSALLADVTVSAVPATADTLSNLPQLLAGRDSDYIANDLVPGNARKACGNRLELHGVIATRESGAIRTWDLTSRGLTWHRHHRREL